MGCEAGVGTGISTAKGRFRWTEVLLHGKTSTDPSSDIVVQDKQTTIVKNDILYEDALEAGYSAEDLVGVLQPSSPMATSSQTGSKAKMKPWSGPLPKPRVSPTRTIGDFLPGNLHGEPTEQQISKSSSPSRNRSGLDPEFPRDASLNRDGSHTGPKSHQPNYHLKVSCATDQSKGIETLRSRRFLQQQKPSRRSYAEVVMVGGVGSGPSKAGGGIHASSHRGNHGRPNLRPFSCCGFDRGRGRGSGTGGGRGQAGTRGGRGNDARTARGDRGRGQAEHGGSSNLDDHGKKRPADATVFDDAGIEDKGKKHQKNLCCEVCEAKHLTSECPIYLGPTPAAIFCGFASDLGFFQIPHEGHASKVPKKETATAHITIKQGNISADLIKSELAWLIPIKWTWLVQQHGDGFLVPFPSKVELQIMVAMKFVHTADGEGIMIFQEWNNKIEPHRYLEKAWINVYGVPYEIRSYLSLWAVGTILGVTFKVDMKYTRKIGVIRILVGIMDVNNIPDTTDIMVGEDIYDILFKVDKICKDENWVSFKQEDANMDNDDLHDDLGAADKAANGDTDMMIRCMMNEIIDKAAFDLINEVTAKVAAEKDSSEEELAHVSDEEGDGLIAGDTTTSNVTLFHSSVFEPEVEGVTSAAVATNDTTVVSEHEVLLRGKDVCKRNGVRANTTNKTMAASLLNLAHTNSGVIDQVAAALDRKHTLYTVPDQRHDLRKKDDEDMIIKAQKLVAK
ncbi:hypothetical protein PR202_ga21750 [Eleusine coracana subsp. coracana]|uniref:DUF4283 domain-containing protein n=1 Tax=Eleusine coracana subsp. coracana TaxID=191504 RepID=A0AAV5D2F6_ELECO|nr:hypothetical protein PR202_ga21750 [Eleusine coracana subsp. coracana]